VGARRWQIGESHDVYGELHTEYSLVKSPIKYCGMSKAPGVTERDSSLIANIAISVRAFFCYPEAS